MPDASFPLPVLHECDVFVAGGGPAGSTIATLLAERGFSVELADKDRHPRFHIGESLLPANIPLFHTLGVYEQIRDIGMLKLGIEFVSPTHAKKTQFLEFAGAWDKTMSYSYQVRRSEFDHVLLKNAAAKGTRVSEGTRVTDVQFLPGGGASVTATDDSGNTMSWMARYFVDATGRDTLLAGKMACKRRNKRNNSAALYGHFTGVERLAGSKEGNITILWFEHGWFWIIPLSDGTTSIGAVGNPEYFKRRKGDLDQFFHDTIALCPALVERLKHASLAGPVTGTGNYSYSATRMSGPGYIMLGDAYAFIDPVFSSGVYLAMRSAVLGADAVEAALRDPDRADAAIRHFEREVKQAIGTFSWFIYRIRSPSIRNLFMNPQNRFRLVEAVLGLLAGDVERGSPIRPRLALFKALYYLQTLGIKLQRPAKPMPAMTKMAEDEQVQEQEAA